MATIETINQVSVVEATNEYLLIQLGGAGSLTAGTGLTGGGSFDQSVTIALNTESIASLALADTALQPGNGVTNDELAAALLGLGTVFQPLHATLTSFGAQSGSGVVVLVGTDTVAVREITGQASQISITNGNGQSGNINVALAAETLAVLALAASALQSGDNISELTNDAGYLTSVAVFTAIAPGLAPASGGGTANFLRADGTWASPTGTTPANPTGTIGLTANNGTETTYMRSDATPALDQGIVPTWTGAHTFTVTPSIVSPTTPQINLREMDVGTNLKSWLIRASGSDFAIGTATDASPLSFSNTAFRITRNQVAVSSLNFGNATDNPVFTFLGTGAISGVGSGLTALNASALTTGTVAPARFGTGTPNSATFFRGDSTWSNNLAGTLLLTGTNDLLRLAGATPFMSWYNSANTTRWGYVQHNGADVAIANELNGTMLFYTNATLSMGIAATGDLRTRAIIRATGWHNTTKSTDELGPGLEIGFVSSAATVQGYNRQTAAYTNVVISGAETTVRVAGTDRFFITASSARSNTAVEAGGWVTAHAAGPHAAVGIASGIAYFHAYNGTTAAFVPIIIRGSGGSLDAGATSALTWLSSGAMNFKSDVWHGDQAGLPRFYYGASGPTYMKSGNNPLATVSIFVFRDSSDVDRVTFTGIGEVLVYAGFRWLQDANYYIYSTNGYTYGSWRIGGSRNGYTGIILDVSSQWTWMSNGTNCGVYTQTGGYWSWIEDGTNFSIQHTVLAPAFQISSSRAIKHELRMPSPLEAKAIIKQLRTVVYRLKDSNAPQYDQLGYIAEEVHELCPWLSPDGKAVMYDRVGLLAVLAMQDE